MCLYSYKLFNMKDDETTIEMFIEFTNIINGLHVLRNFFIELEKVIELLGGQSHNHTRS